MRPVRTHGVQARDPDEDVVPIGEPDDGDYEDDVDDDEDDDVVEDDDEDP